jgi:hypothetical protein
VRAFGIISFKECDVKEMRAIVCYGRYLIFEIFFEGLHPQQRAVDNVLILMKFQYMMGLI